MRTTRTKTKSRRTRLDRARVPSDSRNPDVQARYEGAWQQWGDRSWLPASVQDARFDADSSTRLELVRRSRYWERNNAIVQKLVEVFENYTTGPAGLQLIPSTSDSDFNDSATAWWRDWCKFSDVSSMQPFEVLQSLMARAWFVDGEVFIYKTVSEDSGRPRIQLIEGHRIGTPPELREEEGKSIVDGVEFKTKNDRPVGKPVAYWVRIDDVGFAYGSIPVGIGRGSYIPIPAEQIIHLFEPTRPGMTRGIPFPYPVMNDLHDLDDLQTMEMKAAKAAAEIANIVTTKTGELPTNAARTVRYQIQTQDKAGNPTVKQNPVYYEITTGGRTIGIVNGEKFEQFKTDRPSAASRDFWDYMVRKICAGIGISALLVMPFSLQGTVTRADLDTAAMFFRSRSSVIAATLREIYVWVMGWAVKYDRSLDGAPRDWFRVAVRPPRSITVDVGRNSQAILDELAAGTRTFQDVCAEMGHDWKEVLLQKAVEAKFINDLVNNPKFKGITREQITQLVVTPSKPAPMPPAKPEPQPA